MSAQSCSALLKKFTKSPTHLSFPLAQPTCEANGSSYKAARVGCVLRGTASSQGAFCPQQTREQGHTDSCGWWAGAVLSMHRLGVAWGWQWLLLAANPEKDFSALSKRTMAILV